MNLKLDNTSTNIIIESLTEIKQSMMVKQDQIHAGKIEQLIEKMNMQQIYMTFCGHFSAGKSSLINHLCGHKLLPSSPIPTSSNVVSICNGQSEAIIKSRLEQEKKSIELEDLQAYCVNRTDIESVEIQYPIPFLKDNITLIDTPGIDSTDEAHFLSTESALHLADVVFYVMDYNHVQSEVNFNFVKRLQEWGKPLYLLINQIDKHKEHELSFENYRENVKQAFADWNIVPNGFIYLSVKFQDHPYNELDQLQGLIHKLTEHTVDLRNMNIKSSTKQLIKEHLKSISEHSETNKAEYQQIFTSVEEDQAKVEQQLNALKSNLEKTEKTASDIEQALKKEVRSLLDNAMIMPALTRDLAQLFLQSCKPGFKVGLFFTANKTKEEQTKRLIRFQQDLSEKVHAHIELHLQELLRKYVGQADIQLNNIYHQISEIRINIESQWLQDQVQASSLFSDEYTMNYCNQVASEIKETYRKQANKIISVITSSVKQLSKDKAVSMLEQINELSITSDKYTKLKELIQHEKQYESTLNQMVNWEETVLILPAVQHKKVEFKPVVNDKNNVPQSITKASADPKTTFNHYAQEKLRGRLLRSAEQMKKAYKWIEELPAMESLVKSMKDKTKRLEESQFTIALFGAFSAGKSSFANALLGEGVLPVSPNPTTAAINKIVPPQAEFRHGTAKVMMKSNERLLEEVQYSLGHLGSTCSDMESSLQAINSLRLEQINGKNKPHYTFLKAIQSGWDHAKDLLGQPLHVDFLQFQEYAAVENRSCFVETIELFYSCPFTEAGFILVDTPGADSINARHTGVAFDYIKNADLILFVTYYNHAFSQADREFLWQLGRVKDSFEMDKMFFIINAADLASSDEELHQVVEHLETNLVHYGIRHPRIYSVSSLTALDAKKLDDKEKLEASGVSLFEKEFIQFTSEELLDLAVQSANQEIVRSIQILEQRIIGAEEGEKERAIKAAAIRQSYFESKDYVEKLDFTEEERAVSDEISELLYYVKQRLIYRYNEFFQLAFNPSVFHADVEDAKTALLDAWNELNRLVAHNCAQEILATTLRIENLINSKARIKYEQTNHKMKQMVEIFEPESYISGNFMTPKLEIEFEMMKVDGKWLHSQFKNAKYFFEGEGKNILKKELENKLFDPVGTYVEKYADFLGSHYKVQLLTWLKHLQMQQQQTLKENVEGYISALEMSFDLDDLRDRKLKLQQLLK